ncbi:MAG TPA: hypothetical protein ENN65_04215 [Candidatus Hydrogenedentes bacterium]|nr:hypothetical protein [Candidatus Hydrogenedentota bacterium]
MSDFVLSRVEGAVCVVTLNRPEKRNALTLNMLEAVADAVGAAGRRPEIRAVILEANGPVFSSGVDLMALGALRAEAGDEQPGRFLRRIAERMQRALHLVEGTELPVIAAMQGRVIGLGLELALACDLRVAAEDAAFSIPETRLGLIADVGGTTRLSRIIGPARAKDMLMTARTVDAGEALAWGLVNRVAPPAQLAQAARTLAAEIARNAPLAVGMAKLIIDQGDGLDRYTQMALERWAQSLLISTDDVGEAMAAFMEKRPPQFHGA